MTRSLTPASVALKADWNAMPKSRHAAREPRCPCSTAPSRCHTEDQSCRAEGALWKNSTSIAMQAARRTPYERNHLPTETLSGKDKRQVAPSPLPSPSEGEGVDRRLEAVSMGSAVGSGGLVKDASILHLEHAVGAAGGLGGMRDHDDRLPLLAVHLAESLQQFAAVGRVEVAGGLIRQQQGRLMRQCPHDRHPLLLADGHLAGPAVHHMGDPQPLEKLPGPPVGGDAAHAERNRHVVGASSTPSRLNR